MASKKKAASPEAVAAPAPASTPSIDVSRAPSNTQERLAEFIHSTTGYDVDVQSVRLTLLLTKAFRNSAGERERRENRSHERTNHAELVEQRRKERAEARALKLEEKAAAIRSGTVRPGRPAAAAAVEAPAPVAEAEEANPFEGSDDDDF